LSLIFSLEILGETLNKYKISAASKLTTDTIQSQPILLLSDFWEKYTKYRKPQIAETTLKIQYASADATIEDMVFVAGQRWRIEACFANTFCQY